MGWTSTFKPKDEPLTDFFIRQGFLSWKGETKTTYRVLESAYKMPAYYAAIERVDNETQKREVWAAVFLVKQFKADQSGHNICIKDMSEEMGPCEDDCPERILNLLTPTDSDYANDWRKRCRDKIEEKKGRLKIVPDMRLELDGAIYTVVKSLQQKGYLVKASCGSTYRMNRNQAARATIIQ